MMHRTIEISGPSILAEKRSSSCLIAVVVIVGWPGRGSWRTLGRPGHGSGRALDRLGDILAEQIEVEHLPRDRRGGARAEPGILDQNGERDRGLVGRREGDEERVVAQVLGDIGLHVSLVL